MRSAASWLRDLLFVESRQGQCGSFRSSGGAGWVFRLIVTGRFGIVTERFGNVTGDFGADRDRAGFEAQS